MGEPMPWQALPCDHSGEPKTITRIDRELHTDRRQQACRADHGSKVHRWVQSSV